MTAPVLLSAQYTGSTLYVIFDRAIAVTPAQELDGFTFENDGTPFVPAYISLDENAMLINLGFSPTPSNEVTVAYDGLGTVTEAVAPFDPALAFTAYTTFEIPEVPLPYLARVLTTNNQIAIYFNEPVASTDDDLVTGFVIEVDTVPISMVGVTGALSDDQRTLTLTFPSNFAYDNGVEVIYVPGTLYTWDSGAVGAFELDADNLSTDGLPTSQYPLSYLTKYEVEILQGVAIPKIGVSLNPVDNKLVQEYGPARISTGGTFGITLTNPMGITVIGKFVYVTDGIVVSEHFFDASVSMADRVTAAEEWQDAIIVRIAQALGKVRADDQSVILNATTIVQV